jgi:hypothetical protein
LAAWKSSERFPVAIGHKIRADGARSASRYALGISESPGYMT